MCKTGGDLDRFHEVLKGEVVLVPKIFSLLRQFQASLLKGLSEITFFWLLFSVLVASFWIDSRDPAWKSRSIKSASGFCV